MSAPFLNAQLSNFDNSTTYIIRLGRKFNQRISSSITFEHAPSGCSDVSLLNPTCENNTLSFAAQYKLNNGVIIASGINLRKYKTATTTDSMGNIKFSGNTLTALGIKRSKPF